MLQLIAFSLGNEAGVGKNFELARKWRKTIYTNVP